MPPRLKPWVPYLKQAAFITLRSPNCVRIAQEISGVMMRSFSRTRPICINRLI
jgi:hypothetical protein